MAGPSNKNIMKINMKMKIKEAVGGVCASYMAGASRHNLWPMHGERDWGKARATSEACLPSGRTLCILRKTCIAHEPFTAHDHSLGRQGGGGLNRRLFSDSRRFASYCLTVGMHRACLSGRFRGGETREKVCSTTTQPSD